MAADHSGLASRGAITARITATAATSLYGKLGDPEVGVVDEA
jgi:hypothetical protein